MSFENNISIIIQARTGSTRLPNKMLLPIYDDKTILEIIILNLLIYFEPSQIIVATSLNHNDNQLEHIAGRLNVKCFRGSENDVLDRFIGAAEFFNVHNIIRVCADNPLLQVDQVKLLADEFLKRNDTLDYLSFAFPDGTPVIKSHIGLFAEATKLDVLKKVNELTNEMFYHEHVTNFIYQNPDLFHVDFIELPLELQNRKEIRLTIDTKKDFENVKEIIEKNKPIHNYEISVTQILDCIDNNNELLKSMANEIERNSK